MRLADFEAMVRQQSSQIPAEFYEGIAEVVVSPRTVAHPERDDIWTLGECIPLPGEDGDPRSLQSRIVLYHGSFQALARGRPGFDWSKEAWETLTHEVRHHVEWKARAPGLEALDRAAEANFARQDGEPFDALFYRDGVRLPDGSFQVDDDFFLERMVAALPPSLRFRWGGTDYEVTIPEDAGVPGFLTVNGVPDVAGELVLVLQKKSGWQELFRRPWVYQAEVQARALSD